MRKFAALFLLLFASTVWGQQDQANYPPNFDANAYYIQGIAPGYRPSRGTGLTLNIAKGTANCSGTRAAYAGSTLTMADNTTNYVYLDPTAACAPAVTTGSYPAGTLWIATVVTASGVIHPFSTTGISCPSAPCSTDDRSWFAVTNLSLTVNNIRDCELYFGDPGSGSVPLANDNDTPAACGNDFGVDYTITAVACYADAGTPTVTPILTGGSGTSILTGALTCGTASWAAGTVNGTPTVHTFSANGATCASPPCTIDANITTAGGTAKYIILRIKRTL